MGKILKLKDVCEIGGGYAFKSSQYKTEGTPLIRIGDISDKSIEISDKSVYIDEDIDKYKKFIINKGDILIALSGATTGKFGIYEYDDKALLNQRVAKIYPNELVENKYLYHYMNKLKDVIYSKAAGCAQPNISPNEIGEIEIYVPSIDNQKKIVEALDKAESLIDKKKEQLDLLDELVKSRFVEMFGDPFKNEKNWEISRIEKHLNIITDYHSNGSYETLRNNVTLLDSPSYALMVRTTDLENNNFEENVKYIDEHAYNYLEKSKVFGGEIIINKIGSAGKVYLMPFLNRPVSLAMNQFLLRFDEDRVNHIYLYNLLLTPYMEREIQGKVRGAVTKTITKDAIKEINIPVPPIELQNEFAEFVTKIDSIRSNMEASLSELEDNFNSLMQKAFKGELFI